MASISPTDGSEDVNDFLQRIKELGDRRDQEDEERNRKLEEEILQGRKERQARRAERARSISPTKSSPSNTPTTSRVSAAQRSSLSSSTPPRIDPRSDTEPHEATIGDTMDRLTGSQTKENSKASDSGRGSGGESDLKRAPTLSWQQRRPKSQASDRIRPLSMVATENAARSPRATPEPSNTGDETMSREQIAQSLSSKDPAWFRQTADRGLNSPAYRKNQVEDEDRSDHGSSSGRIQMPGMGIGVDSSQSEKSPIDRSMPPSRSSGSPTNSSSAGAFSLTSPLSLTPAQKLDPPGDTRGDSRTLAMSPSQGRIFPERLERSPSPTKGMGGFVQSAMMKRSDSVNKRWSVQSPPGLNRGNSVATNRNNQDTGNGVALGTVLSAPRPTSLSRDSSHEPSSRPSSSHSNTTVTQERPGTSSSMRSTATVPTTEDGFAKPGLPASRSRTPTRGQSGQDGMAKADFTLPVSPTKSMDSRRWSPTKSSWLESALNKPESPKPKAAPPPQQPSWMSEINKAKNKSIDLGYGPVVASKHEVKLDGLVRSPPPGGLSKTPAIGGFPAPFSSTMGSRSCAESRVSPYEKDQPPQLAFTRGSLASASSVKPSAFSSKSRPDTPPKKDFRANLKPRQPPPSNGASDEPEFKGVFGQLRRTKTQNYVAPDELKDNITRGKASLNLTGGPKRMERKDEFKDAILKKKEDFKKTQSEGKGVTRTVSGASQDTPLPEALAKRQLLGRSGSITLSDSNNVESHSRSKASQEFKPPTLTKENSAPAKFLGKDALGGKLANRFNPALAGLLAKGPPSAASDTSRSSSPAHSQRTISMSTSTTNAEAADAPQLTHMTKARARGPKRKAPSKAVTVPTNDQLSTSNEEKKPFDAAQNARFESTPRSPSPKKTELPANDVENPPSPRKLDVKRRSQFLEEAPVSTSKAEAKPLSPVKISTQLDPSSTSQELKLEPKPMTPKAKPSTPIKSPSLSMKLPSRPAEVEDSPETAKLRPLPLSLSPSKTSVQPAQSPSRHVRTKSVVSVKDVAASFAAKSPAEPARARSPIKLPNRDDEISAEIGAGLRSASPDRLHHSVGLGSQPLKQSARALPTPPVTSHGKEPNPPSPQKHASSTSRPLPIPLKHVQMSASSPVVDKPFSSPRASEASHLISDFFGNHPSPPDFAADTTTVLSARGSDEGLNIRTLRFSLCQLSGDGKKQIVPNHQERVLFEGNMYLCTHTYANATGKRVTFVYYWIGDDVPAGVASEAKIFAQREARSAGGDLVVINQGKEPSEFFSALGGIVIIRRGTSNKYDSLAPHILCGRKHLGQIAFDEVDFSPSCLCSGFPFLVSTQPGKVYLWKGKGSGNEEVSSARLIGMDLGITGEIQEVDEGNEPVSFLRLFGNDTKIPTSADHWKMKPQYENKYGCRLFVATDSKQQIDEIRPFCQSDFDASKVYILDTFFEIYIIVGCAAQSQYASFHHALVFTQEYGILAAGMEDRPFVPFTTIVFSGTPRDMKASFRKWKDSAAITINQATGTQLQRGRSLRVVGLNAALEATRI